MQFAGFFIFAGMFCCSPVRAELCLNGAFSLDHYELKDHAIELSSGITFEMYAITYHILKSLFIFYKKGTLTHTYIYICKYKLYHHIVMWYAMFSWCYVLSVLHRMVILCFFKTYIRYYLVQYLLFCFLKLWNIEIILWYWMCTIKSEYHISKGISAASRKLIFIRLHHFHGKKSVFPFDSASFFFCHPAR